MDNVVRKRTTVTLPEYMLADLSSEARRKGITVSRLIERITEEHMYLPNANTLEAIEEARQGKYAGVVDTSSFEAFKKSMGL